MCARIDSPTLGGKRDPTRLVVLRQPERGACTHAFHLPPDMQPTGVEIEVVGRQAEDLSKSGVIRQPSLGSAPKGRAAMGSVTRSFARDVRAANSRI
jgi:hypothetical protein